MNRDCDAAEDMGERFVKMLKRILLGIAAFAGWIEFVDYCDKF